jgi:hypothetical protein
MVAETSFPKRIKINGWVKNEISKRNLNFALRQVFSNLVSPPGAKKISGKRPSLSQVFLTKKKTVAETSFDGNLSFPKKRKKKKQI